MEDDSEEWNAETTKRRRSALGAPEQALRLAVVAGRDEVEPHLLVILAAHSSKLWEGLDVELVQAESDSEAAAMIFKGEVQAACGEYLPLMQYWASGCRSRVICSPTRAGITPLQQHAVLFTNENFEKCEPHACLCLARGVIRAARQLHDDASFFVQAARRFGGAAARTLGDNELLLVWHQLTEAGIFAVNGASGRAHWGPRLEQVMASSDGRLTISYEDFVAYGHVANALQKLGRHPSRFDAI